MTDEEIAIMLADVFREAGANYPGEPEVILGGRYPLVIVWDDVNESTAVIACTGNRHDRHAKAFAFEEACAMAAREENTTCPFWSFVAHPAATDPNAIVIPELIWNGI